MGHPGIFYCFFWSFQTNSNTICTTIYVKKCPSSIRYRNLNPQPLGCESPAITTRPGLPPSPADSYLEESNCVGGTLRLKTKLRIKMNKNRVLYFLLAWWVVRLVGRGPWMLLERNEKSICT